MIHQKLPRRHDLSPSICHIESPAVDFEVRKEGKSTLDCGIRLQTSLHFNPFPFQSHRPIHAVAILERRESASSTHLPYHSTSKTCLSYTLPRCLVSALPAESHVHRVFIIPAIACVAAVPWGTRPAVRPVAAGDTPDIAMPAADPPSCMVAGAAGCVACPAVACLEVPWVEARCAVLRVIRRLSRRRRRHCYRLALVR